MLPPPPVAESLGLELYLQNTAWIIFHWSHYVLIYFFEKYHSSLPTQITVWDFSKTYPH